MRRSEPPRPHIGARMGTAVFCLAPLCGAPCVLGGEEICIPEEKRMEARVAGVLTAPAASPMHMPTDVAVDSEGRVFVADGANDRVVRFGAQGTYEGAIAAAGGRNLRRPVGLGLDASGQLWVADAGNRRLLVLAASGDLRQAIDLPPTENGRETDPTDVAVTPDGTRAYVVDNDHHRLLVRENRTGAWSSLGRFGDLRGQFQWPFMICIDSEGYAYVSEAVGGRIQRVSSADRWAPPIGRWGVQPGELHRPKGVAIDPAGRLYVSDSTLQIVQVFSTTDTAGEWKGVLTDPQGRALRFRHPMGLCLDTKGRLYVVELRAGCVSILSFTSPG